MASVKILTHVRKLSILDNLLETGSGTFLDSY